MDWVHTSFLQLSNEGDLQKLATSLEVVYNHMLKPQFSKAKGDPAQVKSLGGNVDVNVVVETFIGASIVEASGISATKAIMADLPPMHSFVLHSRELLQLLTKLRYVITNVFDVRFLQWMDTKSGYWTKYAQAQYTVENKTLWTPFKKYEDFVKELGLPALFRQIRDEAERIQGNIDAADETARSAGNRIEHLPPKTRLHEEIRDGKLWKHGDLVGILTDAKKEATELIKSLEPDTTAHVSNNE